LLESYTASARQRVGQLLVFARSLPSLEREVRGRTGDGDGGDDLDERRCQALVEAAPALALVALGRSVTHAEVRLRVRRRALRLQAGAHEVAASARMHESVTVRCAGEGRVEEGTHRGYTLDAPTPPLMAPKHKLPAMPGSSPAQFV